jgi:two-component system NarL family sensor kinase
MVDIVLPRIDTGKRWAELGLCARVVLIWSALVAVAFLVGSGFLIRNAWEERRITMERAATASLANANAFEREVAATGYLLKGLSRSPALLAGDLKRFYEQLVATPKPEGSWLVLWSCGISIGSS